eukprot:gene7847-16055_t
MTALFPKCISFFSAILIYTHLIYPSESIGFSSSFMSYVSARGSFVNKEPVTKYDEFGRLPQLENTYKAISKASSIVAIRSTNCTVLSFSSQDDSRLILSVGAQTLNPLVNPWQYIYLTGSAGDCRLITRYAQTRVLNYTVSFNVPPSGLYIANEVGRYLQQKTTEGGARPLACHVFIIDAIHGELYEIDAAGNVSEVLGGVAGRGAQMGLEILEHDMASGASLDDIKQLGAKTISKMTEMDSDAMNISTFL